MDVAKKNNLHCLGIGIQGRSDETDESSEIVDIRLVSRRLEILPAILRHLFSLIEFYLKALLILRNKPVSVIHCNDNIALPLAVVLKYLKSAHLIYDAHELESDKNGQKSYNRLIVRTIENRLWRFIDHFVTVSEEISEWYFANFGEKKYTIIYNSPMFSLDNISSNDYFRTKYHIPKNKKIYLYIGKFMPGRGLGELVDFFSEQQNSKRCLILLGDGQLQQEIKLDLVKRGTKNIFIHEKVQHEDVVKYAKSADYGVCLLENVSLSDYLALPNKIFEYAFAKLPIIASDFPEIRKFVRDVDAGMVVSSLRTHDTLNVFEASKFLFNETALATYGWNMQEKKLANLYDTKMVWR